MRTFLYNSVFITILAFFVSATDLFADDHLISRIDVTGNNRIDGDTILNYSKLSVGSAYNQAEVDEALRDLYKTELFSDVQINYDDSRIVITVQENFLINQVAFEGNKAINDDSLRDLVSLKARSTFSKNKLEEDISTIISSYRSAGRYSVVVEPKIIKLDFNRIDLVYEINEGSITKITDINFIGNQNYSDRVLRSVISTSRSTWIDKIWGTGRSYDNAIMEYDKELLAQFYRDNGYLNARVSDVQREPDGDKVNLIIQVAEGKKFTINKVSVSGIKAISVSDVLPLLEMKNGRVYSSKGIQTDLSGLRRYYADNGYSNVRVTPRIDSASETTVNIEYSVSEGVQSTVELINISGNDQTLDKVIRRELAIAPGDVFSETRLDVSRNRLMGLGFFDAVSISPEYHSFRSVKFTRLDLSRPDVAS